MSSRSTDLDVSLAPQTPHDRSRTHTAFRRVLWASPKMVYIIRFTVFTWNSVTWLPKVAAAREVGKWSSWVPRRKRDIVGRTTSQSLSQRPMRRIT